MLALIEILVFMPIFMLIILVLAAGTDTVRVRPSGSVMAASSIIFLLYLANTQVQYDFFGFKLMLSALTVSLFRFFCLSHHFIISPDILSRYSLLLLIFKQTLKIVQPFPASAR